MRFEDIFRSSMISFLFLTLLFISYKNAHGGGHTVSANRIQQVLMKYGDPTPGATASKIEKGEMTLEELMMRLKINQDKQLEKRFNKSKQQPVQTQKCTWVKIGPFSKKDCGDE